jgi:hypothetical protein
LNDPPGPPAAGLTDPLKSPRSSADDAERNDSAPVEYVGEFPSSSPSSPSSIGE